MASYEQRIKAAFPALCWARAYHWSQGEHTLQEAVDWLQDWALTRGLVELIGQDAVQAMMAAAFLPWREELERPAGAERPWVYVNGLPGRMITAAELRHWEPSATTLAAAEQLVREGDAARFKDWLLAHPKEMQPKIVKHLETKRRP